MYIFVGKVSKRIVEISVGRQYQLTKVLREKRQVNLVNITTGMRIRVSKFSFLGPRYNNTCPEIKKNTYSSSSSSKAQAQIKLVWSIGLQFCLCLMGLHILVRLQHTMVPCSMSQMSQ